MLFHMRKTLWCWNKVWCLLQAVKWAGDVVDNELMNKKSSKSAPAVALHAAALICPVVLLKCA